MWIPLDEVTSVKIGRLIGSGSFGNVFDCGEYVLKLSRVFPDTENEPTGKSNRELYVLTNMIRPLLKKCPFFLYSRYIFTIPYTLKLKKEYYAGPCRGILMEKAAGTLAQYFSIQRNVSETVSCILQIAVAVHFLQMEYQIHMGDIKATNIVYTYTNRSVPVLWKGEIFGQEVTIQNNGVMFHIIDFGVAKSYSPRFPMFWNPVEKEHNLGTRVLYIDGKRAVPFRTKHSEISLTFGTTVVPKVQFHMGENGEVPQEPVIIGPEEKKIFERENCPLETGFEFFEKPWFIPPIDFFIDCQDIIRMFLGAPRAAGYQGDHCVLSGVPKEIVDFLKGLYWNENYLPEYVFYYLAGYLTHVF